MSESVILLISKFVLSSFFVCFQKNISEDDPVDVLHDDYHETFIDYIIFLIEVWNFFF